MAKIYLVRHGEASAHWTDGTDAGLSALGTEQAQAAATRLAQLKPMVLVSSPLRRARETAAPLEAAWKRSARIVDAVTELPTPGIPFAERSAWVDRLVQGGWKSADGELHGWRSSLLDFLMGCDRDIVVFSHYVAINAAVGAALGTDEFALFRPANASVTIIDNHGGRLRLIEQGASGHHRPPPDPPR